MKNKQLIITGATKGIGRAVLDLFASKGYDVVTCARTFDDLETLKVDFESKYPSQVIKILQADLSDKKGRLSFVEFIEKIECDVLINNTGIFIPGTIHEEAEGILEQSIETNLYSAYDVSRALIPAMKNRQEGQIFNICSTASIMAYENGGSYCISKFALLGFSKVLRQELKQFGIKVISILPGATFTSSWEGVEIPEDRFMPASDIAQTIWDVSQLGNRTVVEEIVIRPMLGDL
jgi:short-subunit dehydrogenase